MKIFGHRGSSKDFGDNNLESFRNSYEIGTDGVEMDVCITRDNVLIMGHNPIEKTSGVPVYERSYEESDLKFEDVLKEMPKNTTCIIDIKDNRIDSDICRYIFELCCVYKCIDQCIFASFNEYHLIEFEKIERSLGIKIQKAYITGNMIKNLISTKSDIFNLTHLIMYKFQVNKEIVEECHEKNIEVFIYTCNTFGLFNYMGKINIDGIITDCPGYFV